MTSSYVTSVLPFLAVLVPALGLVLVAFSKNSTSTKVVFGVALLDFLVVLSMYPAVSHGHTLLMILNSGFQLKLTFMADALSILTGLIGIIVWTLASFYAIEYLKHGHGQQRYNFFSLLSLIGMMGVVFTGNLFSLYIFFELLSVASYVMVVHEETAKAKQAGFVYLFMGVIGGLILLFAVIGTYAVAGSGNIYEVLDSLHKFKTHPLTPYIFWCYIIGFGVKAGLFPVHVWLPLAHPVAPSPASALLSGIMIKAGAYGIFRTIYAILGISVMRGSASLWALLVLAWINIILGSAMAITQTEIKKMLAYSSISQIGYVILGAALANSMGIVGGTLHIFNHAIIKVTLFLCAGIYIHQTGLRQLEDLKGIGKLMPVTTLCFTLGGLSMIGFPPFNGFISKWFLAQGSLKLMEFGSYQSVIGITSLIVLLLSSLMNLIYYGPIIYNAWFATNGKLSAFVPAGAHGGQGGHNPGADAHASHDSHGDHHSAEEEEYIPNADPNWLMKAPVLILGVAIVYFGIFPSLPVNLASQVAKLFLP